MHKGPSKSTVIIQRLLEERRQYEAWIVRLNDSADATPGHVRARVRAARTSHPRPTQDKPERVAAEDELAFIKSVTDDDKSAPSARRASGAQYQPVIPESTPRNLPASSPTPASPPTPEPIDAEE